MNIKSRITKSFTTVSFVSPAFLLYTIFVVGSLLGGVYLSMFAWRGIGPMNFVGFENYRSVLTDNQFWNAFGHNVIWAIFSMIVPTSIGLVLANYLSRSPVKGKSFFRVVLFLPQVLSTVVIAIVWKWIFHPEVGLVNIFLKSIGLGFLARGWLGSSTWALYALMIMFSWFHYGFCMVIFIAAIQGIDESYYDAAKVDGASTLQEFRYITVPLISYAIAIILIVTAISSFQVFDFVFLVTRGGPGISTRVVSLLVYNNAFRSGFVGYSTAMGVILAVIVFIISFISLRLRMRRLS
jgi:raffinose/stachyose/melibiose transport system permease protein